MDSIQKFLLSAAIFLSIIFGALLLTSAKAPTPTYSIHRITSYDGVVVYGYGDYIIVKTDNSVSITK